MPQLAKTLLANTRAATSDYRAHLGSSAVTPAPPLHPVLQLQQLIGNYAVARLLAPGGSTSQPIVQRENGDDDETGPSQRSQKEIDKRAEQRMKEVEYVRDPATGRYQERPIGKPKRTVGEKVKTGVLTALSGAQKTVFEQSPTKIRSNYQRLKILTHAVDQFRSELKRSKKQNKLTQKARLLAGQAELFSTTPLPAPVIVGSPIFAAQYRLLQVAAGRLVRTYEKYRQSLRKEDDDQQVAPQPANQPGGTGPLVLADVPDTDEPGFELINDLLQDVQPETDNQDAPQGDVPHTNQQPRPVIGGYRTRGDTQDSESTDEEVEQKPRPLIGGYRRR